MGLGGALNSGVSGIRLHQNMLDVIGNNLANVNTYGYKSSRLLFADLLSQTLSNGKGGNPMQVGKGVTVGSITSNFSQGTLETTNRPFDFALQGEGFFVLDGGSRDYFTRVGAFTVDSSNMLVDSNTGYKVMDTSGKSIEIPYGSFVKAKGTSKVEFSGNLSASDDSSQSEVLLMDSPLEVSNTAVTSLTAGTTDLNDLDSNIEDYVSGDKIVITGTASDGTPVSAQFIYGTDNDSDGTADTTVGDLIDFLNTSGVFGGDATASIDDNGKIKLKSDTSGQDELTLSLTDGGSTKKTNWDSHKFSGALHTTSTDFFDSQGTRHTVTFRFTKEGDNTWDMTASMDSKDGVLEDDSGVTDNTITGITFDEKGTFQSSGDSVLNFKFGTSSAVEIIVNLNITQNGGKSTASVSSQDGYPAGDFDTVSITSGGTLKALYTNGITQDITTLKIALFNNLNGLAKAGDNLLIQTTASGDATFTTGGSGRAGTVASGFLEGSNVDMATELTALITAQRGFQLNTKVITTADEILAEAVNLKR